MNASKNRLSFSSKAEENKEFKIDLLKSDILKKSTSINVQKIPKESVFLSPSDKKTTFFGNSTSIAYNLKNIESLNNPKLSLSRGHIYSRYSKGRESVISLFGKVRTDSNLHQISKEIRKYSLSDNLTNDQLIDIAINALQKAANYRSNNDVKMLVKSTENVEFFQKMIKEGDRESHEQCCKYMTYQYLKSGETVFKEGSMGTTFYIILRGSVGIHIVMKKIDSNQIIEKKIVSELKPKNQTNNNIMKKFFSTNKDVFKKKETDYSQKSLLTKNEEYQINEKEMKKVKVLGQGNSFGDLALLEKKPRAATIICEEDCHFAVLEKEFFNGILKEKREKLLYKEIEFFASMKIFNHWSYNSVKKLYLSMDEREFIKNKFVYKERDNAEEFYFVKSGEFKIIKKIIYKNELMNLQSEIDDLKSYNSNTNGNISLKDHRIIEKDFELSILERGECFGEIELKNKTQRKTSVICSSSIGSLYVLKKDDFNRLIINEEKSNLLLEEQITHKYIFLNQRIKNYLQTIRYIKRKNSRLINPINDIISMSDDDDFLNIDLSKNIQKNIKKQKIQRASISDTMITPEEIIKTLNNEQNLKWLSPNSPRKNFFMLNNFIKNQKIKKNKLIENINDNLIIKKMIFSPKTSIVNTEIKQIETNKNLFFDKNKKSKFIDYTFICFPFSNRNIKNCFVNKKFFDNEEIENNNTVKKIKNKNKKLNSETFSQFPDLKINYSNKNIENYREVKSSQNYRQFLPLKYHFDSINNTDKTHKKLINVHKKHKKSNSCFDNYDTNLKNDSNFVIKTISFINQ